jgi:gamma-glutamyltranspeptidase/glutathione hydrolase
VTEQPFTTRPDIVGTFGVAAASHWLAAQSAMAILEAGGNAFDAAAAGGFVLQVVEPHQNGLGGEAPMIAWVAAEGQVHVIDGQGPAPHRATPESFAELGLSLVPGAGLLPACVPGALGSWLLLLERFGTLPLAQILEPAIGYATRGFPVLPSLAATLNAAAPVFRRDWPSSGETWLRGSVPGPGGLLTNPLLAGTYRRLLAAGEAAGPGRERQLEGVRRAFYEGEAAEAIEHFVSLPVRDPQGNHAGLLSADDLASWRATLEAPATVSVGDFEVHKTGPFGQGPVFLQQLRLLEATGATSLQAGGAELVHVVTECAKLAFADREAWYGDPRFVDVPLAKLLSTDYAAGRSRLVGDAANRQFLPGSPGGRAPSLPALASSGRWRGRAGFGHDDAGDALTGPPAGSSREGRGDTCHIDVADRLGNMIAATPSGGWLQSSPAVPGLGFCLGTRAQMFWIEKGLASSIAPGKRPRTTLSPTLVKRGGEPYLAFGTPGGDQQDQWTLRFFLYHALLGMGLQEAIDSPSWHTNHFPSSFHPREAHLNELVVERGLGADVIGSLGIRGHDLVVTAPLTLGRLSAVERGSDGTLRAGADPRAMQAYAVGR